MKLLAGETFEQQLCSILTLRAEEDVAKAKSFKLYLDSILYNLPSKVAKYKPSVYHDDPDVRDIEHQGCTIVFYLDKKKENCTLLGIIDHQCGAAHL